MQQNNRLEVIFLRKSKMMQQIEELYQHQNLEYLDTYEKAKAVLSIYRNVVWSLKNTADNMVCETMATYGKDLDTALVYLSEFAPTDKKKDFEAKVNRLFETKWLIGVIDNALEKIADYPEYGEVYSKILFHYYLSKDKKNDDGCMVYINLERTSYYQRKKEAISLMGIALWGYSLPTLLHEIHKGENIEQRIMGGKEYENTAIRFIK